MVASVVLAHPYEKSFNHAVYQTSIQAFEDLSIKTYHHDLYKEKFDPLLPKHELGKELCNDPLVNQYVVEMLESDILVFIHPNWWGQPPALLKGYIDRTFRPPFAYDFEETDTGSGIAEGKLQGKVGIVFNTSNTEENRENDYFHDPLEYIWKRCVFGFCGIDKVYRKMFRIIADSSFEERIKWLDEVKSVIEQYTK
jgi:NAD(P)H dehydrogenase (quinone)